MQEDCSTPAMLMHAGDNQGPTNVNAVVGGSSSHNGGGNGGGTTLPVALLHLSLQQLEGYSTGEMSPIDSFTIHPTPFPNGEFGTGTSAREAVHTPVQHNSRVSHASASHGWGGDDLFGVTGVGEPHSPMSFTGHTLATTDAAGVPFYASAAPTAGSEDRSPPDAKAQLLQSLHIHTPVSPIPYQMPNNDFTVQNTSTGAGEAQHQQQQSQSTFHATPSSVITDSSPSNKQGIKMRNYTFAPQPSFSPPEGSFLAAVPAVDEHYSVSTPSYAPGNDVGEHIKELQRQLHHQCNGGSNPLASDGTESPFKVKKKVENEPRAVQHTRGTTSSTLHSSSSSTTSVLSVPYSTAETLCHDTTEDRDQTPPSQLSLPAAIGPLTASTSVSSFTVSWASATASPYPTSYRGNTRSGPDPSVRGSNISNISKITSIRQHSSGVAVEQNAAKVNDSADSSLISQKSKMCQSSPDRRRLADPSTLGHQSQEGQQQQSIQAHTERGQSVPLALQVTCRSGGDKTASSLSRRTTISFPSTNVTYTSSAATTVRTGANTQSNYCSAVTFDSSLTPSRGPILEIRMTSPDSQLLPVDILPPTTTAPFLRGDLVTASSLPPTPTSLTPLIRPSSSASNGFNCSSSFGLPAFMSASNASLVAFPRLDAPLRAATAAAAATGCTSSASSPSGAGGGGSGNGDVITDKSNGRVDVAGEVLAFSEVRPPLLPPLLSSPSIRTAELIQVNDGGGASSSATYDDGRNSHCQISSDGRTVDNSSFHSPLLPRQSSRGFTVPSTSFAFDTTPWGTVHTPRIHTRRQPSIHDSATSLYHSSSMLSDNILQTLTHGMALGGVSAAPWRSVVAEAASPTSATDFEMSQYGSRSNNNAYVRLPFYSPTTSATQHHRQYYHHHSHLEHSPQMHASQLMHASTAAAAVFQQHQHDSSLTAASSYLCGSSVMAPVADSLGNGIGTRLQPFLTSTRGQSALRPYSTSPALESSAADRFDPPPTSPSGDSGARQGLREASVPGRCMTPPLRTSAPMAQQLSSAPTASTTTQTVIPTLPANRDVTTFRVPTSREQQRQKQQQHQRQPASGSFFAAADDVLQDPCKFARSRTDDSPVLEGNTSLMTPYAGWWSTSAAMASPSTPQQWRTTLTSVAPESLMPMGQFSENSILVLYDAKNTDDVEPEHQVGRRRSSISGSVSVSSSRGGVVGTVGSGGGNEGRQSSFQQQDRGSAVARRRLPSSGFSAGDSNAPPPIPHDVQATFLQSVHATTMNAVAAPTGCSSALLHLFTCGSPPTQPCTTASFPHFSLSFAGSTGGKGVFCGDALSTDPSIAAAPSPNASAAPPSHAERFARPSLDGFIGLPEAKCVTPQQAEERVGGKTKNADVSESSCSLVSSVPPSPQLPQPLIDNAAAPTSTFSTAVRHPSVAKGGKGSFGVGQAHLLPLVEPEHASMSTSSRLPTLRSLGSSNYQCRMERAKAQMAVSRQSAIQRSQWATRPKGAEPQRQSSMTITTTSAEHRTPSLLQHSTRLANTRDGSDVPQLSEAFHGNTGDYDNTCASTTASLISKKPPSGFNGSEPYSTTANRGQLSAGLTQRSSQRLDMRGAQQHTSEIKRDTVKHHARPDASNGIVRARPVARAMAAAAAPPALFTYTNAIAAMSPAADGDVGHGEGIAPFSIPSLHHYRDVQSMLDDAETRLRRAPVSIIPVLSSRLMRGLNPNLSSSTTTHGQSLSSMRTSVLSPRTPTRAVSVTDSDTCRISASIISAEKTQHSQGLQEMSVTVSSVPLGMQELH